MTELSQMTIITAMPVRQAGRGTVFFAGTLVISAALLFVVQPMFTKIMLPLFGGSPAVWNTAMLFFQAALLVGYAYAHWTAAHLPLLVQFAVHSTLMAITLLTLPIELPDGWGTNSSDLPVLSLIGIMVLAVGFPFAVVSSTAPLLQSWFARSRFRGATDPYFLYAASNAGSLTALLAYPLLVEPLFSVRDQSLAWTGGFFLLAALVVGCGLITLRIGSSVVAPARTDTAAASRVSGRQRLKWIALSFVPSSLLLGVTTHITTDVAAIPLLWVIPLTLYLLSFVVAFSARSFLKHAWVLRSIPYIVILFVVMNGFALYNAVIILAIHLVLLFALALMCHGELTRNRPSTAHLTEFYLLMSLGGMLGGIFNSIVAPLVFTGVYEYPIAIALACLLCPGGDRAKLFGRDAAWVLGTLSAAVAIRYASRDSSEIITLLAQVCLAVFVFGWYTRPIRFGLAIGALLAAPYLYTFDSTRLEQKRSFFGVYTIQQERAGAFLTLKHGTTLHGAQYNDPTRRREPLTYYSTVGPVGQFFAALEGDIIERIGVVGLGAGSVSCYRQSGQNWTFFEIDAGIIEMAHSGRHFTFLRDCAPNARMVVGDARLSLSAEPPKSFELLVLDAFSSDAIPVHLLTREAFSTYASRITPEGFLLVHISNRHLKLAPLVANLGAELGMTALVQKHQPSKDEAAQFVTPSEWVVLTRNVEGLARLAGDERWQELRPRSEAGVWTDDFSNLLGVLKW
jgi:hypothetical protein